jgi:hypothetical protein
VDAGSASRRRCHYLVTTARLGLAGLLVVLGWLVVSDRFYRWAGEGRRFGFRERVDWYVHDAAVFLGRQGMPNRVFVANLGQAGVVLFHNGPAQRVFIDARLEVNSRATFERYRRVLALMAEGDPDWTLLAGGPDETSPEPPAVLLDRRTSTPAIRGMLAMPGWRLVYADAVATVFLPIAAADRLNLPRADLRTLLEKPDN